MSPSYLCASSVAILFLFFGSIPGPTGSGMLPLVEAVNATNVSSANCTIEARSTINPATGLPYCVKIGLLKTGVSSNPFYTNQLPKRVLDNALLDMGSVNVNISVEPTELIWEEGLSAVEAGDYDVFVANIWVLRRRVRKIDFSSAFMSETLGLMYIPDADQEAKMFSFFDPLGMWVWLGVVFCFMGATIAIFIAELLHDTAAQKRDGQLVYRGEMGLGLWNSLFHALMSPFGTMEFNCASTAGKIIQWWVGFFFMIVIAAYTANLASFLTVQQASGLVSKESLLKEPVLSGPGDTAPFIEALGGNVISGGFADKNKGGVQRLGAKSLVDSETNLKTIVATDCSIDWIRLDIPIDSALVFRQDPAVTTFKRLVDESILTLKEMGVLDRWQASGLPTSQCVKAGELTSDALKFSNLRGVFLLAGVISFGMIFWSVVELLIKRHRKVPGATTFIIEPTDSETSSTTPLNTAEPVVTGDEGEGEAPIPKKNVYVTDLNGSGSETVPGTANAE